jgi:hypothetical protein
MPNGSATTWMPFAMIFANTALLGLLADIPRYGCRPDDSRLTNGVRGRRFATVEF